MIKESCQDSWRSCKMTLIQLTGSQKCKCGHERKSHSELSENRGDVCHKLAIKQPDEESEDTKYVCDCKKFEEDANRL